MEIVREIKASWDADVFRRGHAIVSTRLLAQTSPAARFQDQTELGYYRRLAALLKDEQQLAGLCQQLSSVAAKIFRPAALDLMFSGEEGDFKAFSEEIAPVLTGWNQKSLRKGMLSMSEYYGNEGILTAGKVQYVAKGGDFKDAGFRYRGSMSVLETILRYEYLWTRIRVQGGAYGAFANFFTNGSMLFCSYRDPNLEETVQVYDEMVQYLTTFQVSSREMKKYIIGTMSRLDLPLTPALRGLRAMSLYFRGATEKDLTEHRKSVIACAPATIRGLSEVVKTVMDSNRVCVMGSEQKIREASDLFQYIVTLPE